MLLEGENYEWTEKKSIEHHFKSSIGKCEKGGKFCLCSFWISAKDI